LLLCLSKVELWTLTHKCYSLQGTWWITWCSFYNRTWPSKQLSCMQRKNSIKQSVRPFYTMNTHSHNSFWGIIKQWQKFWLCGCHSHDYWKYSLLSCNTV
jgi:hypothetical protein